MTIVAISQPRYLPSCSYIERILISDIFVILDVVQHQPRFFEHRNQLKFKDGLKWLSIPIDRKNSADKIIKNQLILKDSNWQKDHQKAFEILYAKTPFYEEIIPILQRYYSTEKKTLVQACIEMLDLIFEYFEISPNIIRASEYDNWQKNKGELMLEITKHFEGTIYLSGTGGRRYITSELTEKFSRKNVEILYHDYEHPIYQQKFGDFVPYLPIFDIMFYHGKESLKLIKRGTLNAK